MNDFITHLSSASVMLPKQQRTLCEYVLNNMLEASTLTIPQMAEKAGIATATVVRTVQSLGFSGFNDFKKELRKNALIQAGNSYASFFNLQQNLSGTESEVGVRLSNMLFSCEEKVKSLNNPAFIASLTEAVEMLSKAKRIFLLGLRSAFPVALSFETMLFRRGVDIVQLSTQSEYIYDRLFEMTPQDVLFAVASHPAVKKTADAIKICHDRGIPTIVLTNTSDLPTGRYASLLLNTENIDSLTYSAPSFLVMEVLARELDRRSKTDRTAQMAQIDQALEEYHVFLWDT